MAKINPIYNLYEMRKEWCEIERKEPISACRRVELNEFLNKYNISKPFFKEHIDYKGIRKYYKLNNKGEFEISSEIKYFGKEKLNGTNNIRV